LIEINLHWHAENVTDVSVLAQEPWIVPIPGTTKLRRLGENLAAASVQLTAVNLRSIASALSQVTVHGRPRIRRTCNSGLADESCSTSAVYTIVDI
jgi:diketogulonate reductase-like aldo/keto reductase